MKRFRSTEGFFLLDAIISLFVVSVVIIEIILFALNAGGSSVKMNEKIVEFIEAGNRSTVDFFEN